MAGNIKYRIKVDGKEYGPFTESRIRGWIRDRALSDDPERDGWLDESAGMWRGLKERFGPPPAESAPSIFDGITIHGTYRRVTTAGVILFCFWALVFACIRVATGRWPGAGAPPHHNPVNVEAPLEEPVDDPNRTGLSIPFDSADAAAHWDDTPSAVSVPRAPADSGTPALP